MTINDLNNVFVGKLVNSAQGPIVASQVFDERTFTTLDVFEWEVFNGARFTEARAFGMFAEISPMNMHKSKLRISVAPGYPDEPVFEVQVKQVKNYDKYLRDATLVSQIVPIAFDVETIALTDFWDIQLEPIDEAHAKLTKIYVGSPEVKGYVTNRDLFVPTKFTEEIIPSEDIPAVPSDGSIEYTPVDTYHTLKRVAVIPVAALTAFKLCFPKRIRIDLPRVLKSVAVVWNEQYSEGTQDTVAFSSSSGTSGSTSLSIPDSASSAAAVTATLKIEFEDFDASSIFADVYIGYMPAPVNISTLLTKLASMTPANATVSKWPVFKPKSCTIVATGQSISLRANVQVSLSNSWSSSTTSYSRFSTVSDDFAVGLDNNTIQLPPCIHPEITFTGGTSRNLPINATASMTIAASQGPGITATKSKSGTALGRISPTSLPATSGQNIIPTAGLYLMDLDVAPYDYGWFKFRAEVFDASIFA